MASDLTLEQTIALTAPHGTVYDGRYLHVVSDTSVYAYTVGSNGLLTHVGNTDFARGQLYYLAWDGSYVHVFGQNEMFAISFDGSSYTQVGNVESGPNIGIANDRGEIFSIPETNVRVSKWSFDGTDYTEEASVDTPTNAQAYTMRCTNDYLVLARHGAGSCLSLIRTSNMTVLDNLALDYPDACVVKGYTVGVGDAEDFYVYDISGGTFVERAKVNVDPAGEVMDNIDYDGANNFHIYLSDSVQHVAYDGSSLTLGTELSFGEGNRVTWQSSTNIGDYFYVTHTAGYLFVVKGESDLTFFADEVTVDLGTAITFTTEGTLGDADTFLWDFGDGHISTLRNPVHNFDGSGVYTVELVVTFSTGVQKPIVRAGYITVYGPNYSAISGDSDFTGSPVRGRPPLEVTFTNSVLFE